ncbi:PfkB family carbohydrate kinase [bacterium]|nr:PfkB family carbohydrate kinase [bacterium]
MKIVGIGETVFDIVFKDGKPQAAVPGGSVFNAIISLGRTAGAAASGAAASGSAAGASVAGVSASGGTVASSTAAGCAAPRVIMATQMGKDNASEIIIDFMQRNYVETTHTICVEGRQSTISLAMLDSRNDARYEFFRDSAMPKFQTPDIEFEPGDILLFGSFFAISPATRLQVKELVARARSQGAIIYYDINFRKGPHGNSPHIKEYIEENCALSTIVRGSSEDIGNIYGECTAEEAYRDHISSLCSNFICTKGADSTEVFSPGLHAIYPVHKIETLSTIGAGDNFNAGVVYTLSQLPALAALSAPCAASAASVATSACGATPAAGATHASGATPAAGAIHASGATPDALTLGKEEWDKIVTTAHLFSAEVCQSYENYVPEDFLKRYNF